MDAQQSGERVRIKTVRKAGRASFLFRWRENGRWRERSSGIEAKRANRRQAEAAAAEFESKLNAPGCDLIEFHKRYNAEVLDQASACYARTMRFAFQRAEQFGLKRIEQVTASFISQFAAHLADGCSDTTVTTYCRHLLAARRWAHRVGLCADPISVPKGLLKRTARGGVAPTRSEFTRWLLACRDVRPDDYQRWRWILRAFWHSGLRRSETGRLTWDPSDFWLDMSPERPLFRISKQKNQKAQSLPVAPAFARMARRRQQAAGLVFPYEENIDRVGKVVARIARHADLPHTAHDLRRAFGTRWAQQLMPADLMALMRHSSVETTMQYYVDIQSTQLADRLWQSTKLGGKNGGIT